MLARATGGCADVRTLTAELRMSGRVGGQRIRGRAIVGVSRPGLVRLEGVAPFGPPAFILVARDARGTLVLPRDNRVLRDAPPEQILQALTGVSLTPDDLRALLAGCLVPGGAPAGGVRIGDRWARLDWGGAGDLAYVRRDGASWRLVASARAGLDVEYDDFATGRPGRIALRAGQGADLRVTLSQVETNVTLDRDAFDVTVPAGAAALTLDELRAAGPLGRQ